MPPANPQPWSLANPAVRYALALVLLTLLAFAPAFRGSFQWDDGILLLDYKAVVQPGKFLRLWIAPEHADYWPMTETTFWIEYRLWRNSPTGYHVTQILLHIANVLLLWKILRELKVPGAFLGAALFAVHPLCVESVAWISERKNTLSFLFLALSLLAYLRSETRPKALYYWLSVILFLLSLLSKTSVVMFPFVLMLMEWFRHGRVTLRQCLASIPYFLCSLVLGLVTMDYQELVVGKAHPNNIALQIVSRGWDVRLAQAGYSIWFYVYKSLLPIDLGVVYPEWRVERVIGWVMWMPLIAAVIVTLVIWWVRKTFAGQALAFGLGYFALNLVLVLGAINMQHLEVSVVADHFVYLSLPGITALFGALWAWGDTRMPIAAARHGLRIAAASVILVLSVATFNLSETYRTELTLWYANLQRRPNSWFVNSMFANYMRAAGHQADAVTLLHNAIRLHPAGGSPRTWRVLGLSLNELGDHMGAADAYMHAEMWADAGYSLYLAGHRQEAMTLLQREITEGDSPSVSYLYLGQIYDAEKNLPAAADAYRQYIKLLPDLPKAHNNLGSVLMQMKDYNGAAAEYQAAVDCEPRRAMGWFNLGAALWSAGRTAEARAAFDRAVEIDPRVAAKVPQ